MSSPRSSESSTPHSTGTEPVSWGYGPSLFICRTHTQTSEGECLQTIPVIYSVISDLKLHAGRPVISKGKISVNDVVPAVTLPELKSGKERGKVIVIDTVGINRGIFNADFIEFCRTPGNELWLMEPIYDENDALDVFLGYADKVIFPYSDIWKDSVLKDILEISDNCVPLVVCRNRTYDGKDPVSIVRKLSETGFHNIMVADMDGTISPDTWERLLDECGGLITYSPFTTIETECHILAQDVFPLTRE